MGFLRKLILQWDLYKKVPEEFYESTYSGVCLSMTGIALMTLLFAFELSSFLTVTHTTDIIMEHGENALSHEGVISINFDISFHDLPCQYASVDVYDITGTRKHDVSKNIVKTRLDHKGRDLGKIESLAIEPEEHESVATREQNELEALLSQDLDQNAHSDKLDANSFKSYLTEHKDQLVMVDFFAPWCIWCRRLEPIWENTAKKMMGNHKGSSNPIRLASVDCTKETKLCQDYFVRAYPTIYFFTDGNPKPREAYHGERTTTALIKRAHQVKAGAQHHADVTKQRLHEEDKKKGEVVSDLGGHEGCNIKGTSFVFCIVHLWTRTYSFKTHTHTHTGRLMVKRVPGNFHVQLHSPRYSHDSELVNASHTVNRLNFGDPIGEHRLRQMTSMPEALLDDISSDHLDDKTFISTMKNYTYVHYLKVVSKRYEWENYDEDEVHTYLYSAFSNEHKEDDKYPSVMFQYDLSPMTVLSKYHSQPFYHFITNFCAIIGGVFSIIGIIDRLFQTITSRFNKKIL